MPIEVGASNRQIFLYPLRDNTGDNISSENPYYGELTGLYWVWKNGKVKEGDIIGFCHYNKGLNISRRKVEKWLKKEPCGMITLKPSKIRNHPVPEECKAIFEILYNTNISYYETCCKLYDEEFASKYPNCRGGNMLICTGSTFNAYCSWLFPILAEMRRNIGDKLDVNLYWRRYCAYMGERLLSVYIETNHLPVLSVNVKLKSWWIPVLGVLRKSLGISKNNKIYKLLYSKLGYHSSYKKNGK